MVLADWSMSVLGYEAHRRSGSRVVGVTHMHTHAALRLAEAMGLYTGYLQCLGQQPQIAGASDDRPMWVSLAELFVDRKVVATEGVIGGGVVFVATVPADGQPPADRSLIAWAEELGRPWLEELDNEVCYWGGLSDQALLRLLAWFAAQRAFTEPAWQELSFQPRTGGVLLRGLFDCGWTRNLALVDKRGHQQQWWGGVHQQAALDHDTVPSPGQVATGVRLSLSGRELRGERLDEPCPLKDDNGRLIRPA